MPVANSLDAPEGMRARVRCDPDAAARELQLMAVKSSNTATNSQTTKSLQINGLAHPREMAVSLLPHLLP